MNITATVLMEQEQEQHCYSYSKGQPSCLIIILHSALPQLAIASGDKMHQAGVTA